MKGILYTSTQLAKEEDMNYQNGCVRNEGLGLHGNQDQVTQTLTNKFPHVVLGFAHGLETEVYQDDLKRNHKN